MGLLDLRGLAADFCGKAGSVLSLNPIHASPPSVGIVYKSNIFLSALPKGATKIILRNGTIVWKCGPQFYQPHDGRYVRVDVG
jgi:hypothetical protein